MVTRGGSSATAATDTLPVDIAAHALLRLIGRHAGTSADRLVVTHYAG